MVEYSHVQWHVQSSSVEEDEIEKPRHVSLNSKVCVHEKVMRRRNIPISENTTYLLFDYKKISSI